jgi:sialidase-1
MNQTVINWVLLFCSICIFNFGYTQTTKGKGNSVGRINRVEYLKVPVFNNTENNPLFKLDWFVNEMDGESIRNIQLQLDEVAVGVLSSVDIVTRDEREREKDLMRNATVHSTIRNFDRKTNVDVNISLHQGWNTIWFSAKLKKDASILKKMKVALAGITTKDGLAHRFNNTASGKEEGVFRIGTAVRRAGDDKVHTYRIPGIAKTDKGTLIAVYDNRYEHSGDLPANIDVGMSRSTDGGQTWEPMKVIMDMGDPHKNNGVGDPAILFDPVTKKLWVAALWSKGNRSIAGSQPGLSPDTTGQLVLVSSDDDGKTWSQPISITQQVKNPIWHLYFNGPGNGIAMKNGTLVFASQYWDETTKPRSVGIPHSSIIYSTDHGQTWKSGTGAKSNTTEAQVVEATPGTLMLNMRDNRGKFRSVATTTDMGQTWKEHVTSYHTLIDPVCMGGFIKSEIDVKGQKRDVLFFSNAASWHSRINISIKASLDNGNTWLNKNEVLIDERSCYGYSTMVAVDENNIGLLYEGEGDLYFVTVPVADIIQ